MNLDLSKAGYIEVGDFPAEALAQGDGLELTDEVFECRREVRGITIDPEGAGELDDAFFLEETPDRYILTISIADVPSLIKPASYIDHESFSRIATRYGTTPESTKPMLPRRISENLLSLLPNERRPAISITVELNKDDLSIINTRIEKTFLTSERRFTYEEAGAATNDLSNPFQEMLAKSSLLSKRLLQKRQSEGALPVFEINNDPSETPEGRPSSYRTIQEFMILANKIIAQTLEDQRIPALYRNHIAHGTPGEIDEMLAELRETTAVSEELQARAARVLGRASYGPAPLGHFGLNTPIYTHATSPLRRDPDLRVQRNLITMIEEREPLYNTADIARIAAHINRTVFMLTRPQPAQTKPDQPDKVDQILDEHNEERLLELSHQEFLMVLQRAKMKQIFPEHLESVVEIKIAHGCLSAKMLYNILFNPRSPSTILGQIIAHMSLFPKDARTAMRLALAHHQGWARVILSGTPDNKTQRAEIVRDAIAVQAEAQTKSEAYAAAAAEFWKQAMADRIASVAAEFPTEETPTLLREFPIRNYAFMLAKLCRERGIEASFSISGQFPKVTCTCSIPSIPEIEPATCTGTKQRIAIQAAAHKIIVAIKQWEMENLAVAAA